MKERIMNAFNRWIDYLNEMPVERRMPIVIRICAVIVIVAVLKCVYSIATMEEQDNGNLKRELTEVGDGVAVAMKKEMNGVSSKKDTLMQRLMLIEERGTLADTIK